VERVSSDSDHTALQYVSLGLLILSELVALYFAWGSFFSFVFLFVFFFPGLGAMGLCGLCLLLALIGKGFQLAQDVFQALVTNNVATKLNISNSLFVSLPCGLVLLIYILWFGSTSRVVSACLWVLCLLFLPPAWTELCAQVCQMLAGASLSRVYIGIVLRSIFLLGAVVVAAVGLGIAGLAKKLWTRLRDRYQFGRSIDE